MKDRRIKTVNARWTEVVLVCRKCQKKLGGGFGPEGDQSFAKALRRATDPDRAAKGRKSRVGVVAVGCLGLCPKDAVVAVRAAEPGAWRVVPRGTDIRVAATLLGLGEAGGPA